MKFVNILIEHERSNNQKLLESVIYDLLPQQRYIIEGIYKEFEPLIEASLDPAQIKSLFGEIEKQSIQGGKSRTLVGNTVDVAKQVNKVIDNVGKWLQDTTPVKMADEKFDQLKSKIATKFPELDKQLTGLGTWMKENPGKSAAIIGVLTAMASLAGGPVGGAIAGQVLRGSAELIKGEKLSTAVGKGIKTAALGYLSGKAFEILGKYVGGMRAESLPVPGAEDAGLEQVSYGASKTLSAPGVYSKETVQGFNVTVFPQEKEAIEEAMRMIRDGQSGGFDSLQELGRYIHSTEYKSAIKDLLAGARADQLANDGLLKWIDGMAKAGQALSQGAVAGGMATSDSKKESVYYQTRPLSEGQVFILFDHVEAYSRVEFITEGPLDALKKAGSAVAKGAQWIGKQATEKITSAKLLASWKLEGSPTDSEELAKFLKGQGVEDAVIDTSYDIMKLPKPGSTSAATEPAQDMVEPVKQMISKLDVERKARLLKQLLGKEKNAVEPTANA